MAVYGFDSLSDRVFDKDLFRDIENLGVEWSEEYSSAPRLHISLKEGISPFDYFRGIDGQNLYQEIPLLPSGTCIFYCPHPIGFVKYFSHSGKEGRNEGGFGGASFKVLNQHGEHKTLLGPWSSRAAVVNMAVGEHPNLTIMDVIVGGGGYSISVGMKTAAVKALCEMSNASFHIARYHSLKHEKQPWSPWYTNADNTLLCKPYRGSFACPDSSSGGIEYLYTSSQGSKALVK